MARRILVAPAREQLDEEGAPTGRHPDVATDDAARSWPVADRSGGAAADRPPQEVLEPGQDLAALHQKLLDAKITTSLRGDRTGQKYIRLSPHFYNTDDELQRLVELI